MPTTKNTKVKINKIPTTTLSNKDIEEKITIARSRMLHDSPFFGILATRLMLKDASKWCGTMATDGRHFYYNKDFVAALSNEQLIFAVAHEVLHCVYDHLDRGAERNPDIWNFAIDFVVNGELKEEKIGEVITEIEIDNEDNIPINLCLDKRYTGKTSEEVYNILMKNFEENKQTLRIEFDDFDFHIDVGDPFSSNTKSDEGDEDDNDDDNNDDNEQNNEQEDKEDDDGDGEEEGEEEENGPAVLSQEEKEQIKKDFQNAAIQAIRAAKSSGNVPKGVERYFSELLDPKLDWRTMLEMHIKTLVKSDFTWLRPSRKGIEEGFYLPGMDRETTIDVAVAIDTSGSIGTKMLQNFLSEVKGIMDQYNDFNLHLFAFDTKVHNPVTFTPHNMEQFVEYEIKGFGGTNFDCCYNYMKDEGIVPNKFIMFTDGYPYGSWGDEHYCDTLFVVHGSQNSTIPTAPFGTTVAYECDDDE